MTSTGQQLAPSAAKPPRVTEIAIAERDEDGAEHIIERSVWTPADWSWVPLDPDASEPIWGP